MNLSLAIREVRYLVEFLLAWPAFGLIRLLPERLARRLALCVGDLLAFLPTRRRAWCLRDLELVFGDNLSPGERGRIARQSMRHFLLTCVESIRWTERWMLDHVVEDMAQEAWDAAVSARGGGSGAILVTAHLGNFETIPAYGHHLGFRGTVLYRPQNNWRIERLFLQTRQHYLQGMVPRGPFGLLGLMYALRENQSVGLLVDTNTINDPVFVDFLGIPAATPRGAAALALATRCPVILAISIRQPDGRLRIYFEPPFPLIDTGERERDILANTQQYVRAIERYVLAHPEQYLWALPRWRRRPDGTDWGLSTPVEVLARERTGPPRIPTSGPVVATWEKRAA
jgi:KDO2-lipid IV(A) lauroyltransferase